METTTTLDAARHQHSRAVARPQREAIGQFLTPAAIAHFMAAQLSLGLDNRLLDPGAGIGTLAAAVATRLKPGQSLAITAWEPDTLAAARWPELLGSDTLPANVRAQLHRADYVAAAAHSIALGEAPVYTHAILNPPYQKIGVNSTHRLALRSAGIETVNLYAGFVALALLQLQRGGELVAIIPRSFANGPYYRPFRELILREAVVASIHLFKARDQLFGDDAVLQENVILKLVRGGVQGTVQVSFSRDARFDDVQHYTLPFAEFVQPQDMERFFRISEPGTRGALPFHHSLAQVGVEVSTGPVVDFRHKADLRAAPEAGAVPLLYAAHFADGFRWPRGGKKPDAIVRSATVERWLLPNACYVLTKRFSSKEERRRIVAHVLSAGAVPGECVGFENHLNVFHFRKRGLDEDLARGLAAYLNSTMVDQHFRQFSGHTQVNATDLRSLSYPSREQLMFLGAGLGRLDTTKQDVIDAAVEKLA